LKQGYDYFETYRVPPNVAICERRYVVNVTSQSKPEPDGPCPLFQKPPITAFTPMPTEPETVVASGNKLKGLVSADVEPTLADINAAKASQATVPATAAPAAVGATSAIPTANAR
jgi:murein L,D-transpeptidase YafK